MELAIASGVGNILSEQFVWFGNGSLSFQ